MFQSLVVGPVGTEGFGLIRRCVECRARHSGPEGRCDGFGAGCLSRPRAEDKRPGFTYAPLLDVDPRLGGF